MGLIVFNQWDRLVALFRSIASGVAAEKSQYGFNRVISVGGRAKLVDRAVNTLALAGEAVALEMPDIAPGKARDFLLRVTAAGEGNSIRFEGAEAFEADFSSLDPPRDGETIVYFFTETSADVFLVARKSVERIET